jgi:hypothetical protein
MIGINRYTGRVIKHRDAIAKVVARQGVFVPLIVKERLKGRGEGKIDLCYGFFYLSNEGELSDVQAASGVIKTLALPRNVEGFLKQYMPDQRGAWLDYLTEENVVQPGDIDGLKKAVARHGLTMKR